MSELKPVIIDDIEVEVDPALTIIQACEQAGIEIPRFCYHERLSIAGNCRMCLVEVVGGPPKPAASCAMQVRDLRPGPEGQPPVIKTNSPMVKKAREGVMEFLLINHPLDCPICDQGGECDLQDQAMAYGVDFSRFREPKRAVDNMDLGPLVGTAMTRCISCTRCVRFITEVAGMPELGQTGRGEDAEITSYLGQTLDSEMQGNIVDLCPVGALTSKPYAFTARPWELTKTETIDVMDALGSNIRVDTKGREVMRILPRNHDGVNEEWLSDKSRYAWDGLRRQRLDKPYIRENGKLRPASWPEALEAAAKAMNAGKIAGLVGDLAPVEAVYALKELIGDKGEIECRTDGAKLQAGNRSSYVGNATIEDIDSAEMIMLIGCNPRLEAPVLNARIRKAWSKGALVGVIGPDMDLTYDTDMIGHDRAALHEVAAKDRDPSSDSYNAPKVIILGQAALMGADGKSVLAAVMNLCEKGNAKLLVLHTAASRVGALDVGAVANGGLQGALEDAQCVYNLGADEIDIPEGPTVIYQGSHGDRGAHRADIILPAAAWTEENGLFVNTEGRPQLAMRASFPPGEAKENWAILRALSAEMGAKLPFDSLAELRSALVKDVPHLKKIDTVPENEWQLVEAGGEGSGVFTSAVEHHYLTNPILRASPLMAELQANANERQAGKLAAE